MKIVVAVMVTVAMVTAMVTVVLPRRWSTIGARG
jgi:hypothetical protein